MYQISRRLFYVAITTLTLASGHAHSGEMGRLSGSDYGALPLKAKNSLSNSGYIQRFREISEYCRSVFLENIGSLGVAGAGILDEQQLVRLKRQTENNDCLLEAVRDIPPTTRERFEPLIGATAILRMKYKAAGGDEEISDFCTATLIDRWHILTNAHCVLEGDKVRDVVAAGAVFHFEGRFNDPLVREIAVNAGDPVEVDRILDYAVLPLSRSVEFVEPMAMRYRAPKVGEGLYMVHHPAAQEKHISSLNCAVMGVEQSGSHGAVQIRHSCDTLPVSSGALLVSSCDNAVVGIHFGQSGHSNFATRFLDIVQHSRKQAGAGVVGPPGAGAGRLARIATPAGIQSDSNAKGGCETSSAEVGDPFTRERVDRNLEKVMLRGDMESSIEILKANNVDVRGYKGARLIVEMVNQPSLSPDFVRDAMEWLIIRGADTYISTKQFGSLPLSCLQRLNSEAYEFLERERKCTKNVRRR